MNWAIFNGVLALIFFLSTLFWRFRFKRLNNHLDELEDLAKQAIASAEESSKNLKYCINLRDDLADLVKAISKDIENEKS